MEQVLGDDHLCYILLNFAGELDEPRARCVSKHWAQLRRRWVASLPSNACIHANPVFSPDGAIIAVAGSNYTGNSSPFVMYDVRSGAKRLEIIRPEQVFVGVGFLGDGGIVAVAGNTDVLPLYDTRTGALLQEVALPDRWTRELAVSPDGAMLAVGGDETVCIYDAATFERRQAIEYYCAKHYAFSPDSATIAVGGSKKLSLFDVATGALVCEHDRTTSASGTWALAFSPDGQLLAVGGDAYDTDDESDDDGPLVARPVPPLTLYIEAGRVRGPDIACEFAVCCLAFAPNGSVLAVGGMRDIFVLYDTNTFEVRRTLRSDDWAGRAIAFSPDSSKVAIDKKKGFALYETETGDPVRVP